MAAVQNDGSAIQYISNPYEAVKMAAVQQNPEAILLLKNHPSKYNLRQYPKMGTIFRQSIILQSELQWQQLIKEDHI